MSLCLNSCSLLPWIVIGNRICVKKRTHCCLYLHAHRSKSPWLHHSKSLLVGGLNLRKIWKSIGMIIPNRWENKKCSKQPTSLSSLLGTWFLTTSTAGETVVYVHLHWSTVITMSIFKWQHPSFGGFLSHRGTPSHHPFLCQIVPYKPTILDTPMTMETSI